MEPMQPTQPDEPGGAEQGMAPPGWYADPSGQTSWRWWDGVSWTPHVSTGWTAGTAMIQQPTPSSAWSTGYYPVGYPTEPSVHERFAAEQRFRKWTVWGFAVMALIAASGALVAWGESAWLHTVFHALRVQVDTGDHQSVAAVPTRVVVPGYLATALDIGVYVVLINWQYAAAKTAQLLNIPARRSPGLGAWSWIIPVVSFWFPYQAMRDCLPPGHPGRRTVLRMWLAFVVMTPAALVAEVVAAFGSRLAVIPEVVVVGAGAMFVVLACRVVGLITEAHRQLLYPGYDPGDTIAG